MAPMAQRSLGTRGRVVVAGAAGLLLAALAALMAATDTSTATTHAPIVTSAPVAHTITGAS
jgi:hypothetical protein